MHHIGFIVSSPCLTRCFFTQRSIYLKSGPTSSFEAYSYLQHSSKHEKENGSTRTREPRASWRGNISPGRNGEVKQPGIFDGGYTTSSYQHSGSNHYAFYFGFNGVRQYSTTCYTLGFAFLFRRSALALWLRGSIGYYIIWSSHSSAWYNFPSGYYDFLISVGPYHPARQWTHLPFRECGGLWSDGWSTRRVGKSKLSVGKNCSGKMLMIFAWSQMSRYHTSLKSQILKNTKGTLAPGVIWQCMQGRCRHRPIIISSLSTTSKIVWLVPPWSGTWVWTVLISELSMIWARPTSANTSTIWIWPRTEKNFRLWLRKTRRPLRNMPKGGGRSLLKSAHLWKRKRWPRFS